MTSMTFDEFVKDLVRQMPDKDPNQTAFIVNVATELLLRHGDKISPDDCVDKAKRLAYGLQIRVLKNGK